MKTVVITGCYGFIGAHVTQRCLDKGWKVLGIDKMTYASNRDISFSMFSNFTFLEKDICELDRLPDCDYIINIAAESHVGNSIIDSGDFLKSNVEGVKNLLDLIRAKPENVVSKPILFHFSTDEVYGDGISPAIETSPLNPSNPYSASKAAADMLIKAWSRTYGIDYIILRPSNNYGKFQYPEKLVPLSVKLLNRGKKIRLHNRGEPTRTWLHVEDTAEAVITIIESGVKNQIFNVSGDEVQKNIDTVRKIINSYFGNNLSVNDRWMNWVDKDYIRPGQDVQYIINDEKLRMLGWRPTRKFDNEIREIVEHYQEKFIW
jgi:dTDP-glucose 4,6-dehydratase